jgi:AraC family transcriptional regulator of arabinose operon
MKSILSSNHDVEDSNKLILAGHFQEHDNYSVRRPLGRRDWLVTFTLEGQGYFRLAESEIMVYPGDFAILRPDVSQHYGTPPGCEWKFVWVHFPINWVEHVNLLPVKDLFVHHLDNESLRTRMFQTFQRIRTDSFARMPYWRELCQQSLREMILLIAQGTTGRIDARIQEVLYILSQHMTEPWKIEDLARKVGLSSSRLSHLFKQETGQTIVESLNQMRIRQAALLLEHTDRTASEVAIDVGFYNYNHFANQFRARYGVSPGKYKSKG